MNSAGREILVMIPSLPILSLGFLLTQGSQSPALPG